MRTAAVLPVKSFGRSKTRTALTEDERVRLAGRLVAHTLETLHRVRAIDAVYVVTQEMRAARAAREHGYVVVPDPREVSHSAAARLGIDVAVRAGAERVLLVPGDCPELAADELDTLLASSQEGVTIVADRHGSGTNALVLCPPYAIDPSFGPGSFARHAAYARGAGAPLRVAHVPSLAFDIDTPQDLADAQQRLDDPAVLR